MDFLKYKKNIFRRYYGDKNHPVCMEIYKSVYDNGPTHAGSVLKATILNSLNVVYG
jgi:hypothetical protein